MRARREATTCGTDRPQAAQRMTNPLTTKNSSGASVKYMVTCPTTGNTSPGSAPQTWVVRPVKW